MILLDTHVLLWMDANHPSLGPSVREAIRAEWLQGGVAVCAISFWEVGMLEQRARVHLPLPATHWREELIRAGVQEIPLDGHIATVAAALPDFHKDPADRFIVAAAIQAGATLWTADSLILEWTGPLERRDARN